MASYEHRGYCPICEAKVRFTSNSEWYRDHLRCQNCNSVVRERALALVLGEIAPDWRSLSIHESSPAPRGISLKLRREAPGYVASQYFPDAPRGAIVDGFRNENLESQTFADDSLGLVVSLDVMEHVFDPAAAYREIHRTLKPGGHYLHTVPIHKAQIEAARRRAEIGPDGAVRHLAGEPSYHGNPIDPNGSLVTFDYGYDLHQQIAAWAPFEVRVIRFCDPDHGVIGEYTEVVVCRKPDKATKARAGERSWWRSLRKALKRRAGAK